MRIILDLAAFDHTVERGEREISGRGQNCENYATPLPPPPPLRLNFFTERRGVERPPPSSSIIRHAADHDDATTRRRDRNSQSPSLSGRNRCFREECFTTGWLW